MHFIQRVLQLLLIPVLLPYIPQTARPETYSNCSQKKQTRDHALCFFRFLLCRIGRIRIRYRFCRCWSTIRPFRKLGFKLIMAICYFILNFRFVRTVVRYIPTILILSLIIFRLSSFVQIKGVTGFNRCHKSFTGFAKINTVYFSITYWTDLCSHKYLLFLFDTLFLPLTLYSFLSYVNILFSGLTSPLKVTIISLTYDLQEV